MRLLVVVLATWFGLLSCFAMATATADEQAAGSTGGEQAAGSTGGDLSSGISDDPQDPTSLLTSTIPERRDQREAVFRVHPLDVVHNATGKWWNNVYRATHLKLGLTFNTLFQGVTNALPDEDSWGVTTDSDFVGGWEVLHRGKPNQGKLFFHLEGRWDYGTTGPQNLGFVSLATAGGTANAFSAYNPTFLMRNLYWEQGSRKAKWVYRIGKITTDSILATSQHITPVTTFLPNLGTGLFSSGYPDSGLGAVGVWYPHDRFRVLGLVSDANGDRYNFGDIGAGDFYTALEFGFKIAPKTEKAGFSKVTVWHNDGTEDGQPINASTGAEGYGMTIKLEQELTHDGRAIGILRWGNSWNDSSLFKQQVGAHFLLYDLFPSAGLQHDLVGIAANWVDSSKAGSRDEYNMEVFYRFPLFPNVDTRLSYQYIIHPALTRDIDQASVFSLGFRSVF